MSRFYWHIIRLIHLTHFAMFVEDMPPRLKQVLSTCRSKGNKHLFDWPHGKLSAA